MTHPLDGDALVDTPEDYAQKTYAFFLHTIAEQHDSEDDGNVLLDDYLRSTMVLARVRALLEDHGDLVPFALALVWHHDAYNNMDDDDPAEIPTADDLLK